MLDCFGCFFLLSLAFEVTWFLGLFQVVSGSFSFSCVYGCSSSSNSSACFTLYHVVFVYVYVVESRSGCLGCWSCFTLCYVV